MLSKQNQLQQKKHSYLTAQAQGLLTQIYICVPQFINYYRHI